jgi:excisionase family DNA binding protein
MTSEILTLPEACTFLRMSPRTMQALLREGRIPGAFRPGKKWLFSKQVLLAAFHTEGGGGADAGKTARRK